MEASIDGKSRVTVPAGEPVIVRVKPVFGHGIERALSVTSVDMLSEQRQELAFRHLGVFGYEPLESVTGIGATPGFAFSGHGSFTLT